MRTLAECGWLIAVSSLVLLGGCRCRPGEAVQGDAGNAQRDADLARLPQSGGSLGDQFAAEAAARPEGAPSLEKLAVALAPAGLTFGPTRQVFGRKHLAIYCGSSDVGGMTLTMCEYPSAEQATRGELESNQLFGLMSGHRSKVRKQSALHVVARSDVPAEQLAAVWAAFEAL